MTEPNHDAAWPSERELGRGLGYRLKAVREAQKLSQAELARRLGLAKSSIAKYEAGAHLPGLPVLVRLSLGLRVSTDYLVGLSEDYLVGVVASQPDDAELAQVLRSMVDLDEIGRQLVVPLIGAMVKLCRARAAREHPEPEPRQS